MFVVPASLMQEDRWLHVHDTTGDAAASCGAGTTAPDTSAPWEFVQAKLGVVVNVGVDGTVSYPRTLAEHRAITNAMEGLGADLTGQVEEHGEPRALSAPVKRTGSADGGEVPVAAKKPRTGH